MQARHQADGPGQFCGFGVWAGVLAALDPAAVGRAQGGGEAAPAGELAADRLPTGAQARVVFQFVSVDFTKLFHELVRSLFELVHYCRRELGPGKGPVEPYVSVKLATVTLSCSSELIHKIPRPCIGII